jgi:hypothetical protein
MSNNFYEKYASLNITDSLTENFGVELETLSRDDTRLESVFKKKPKKSFTI